MAIKHAIQLSILVFSFILLGSCSPIGGTNPPIGAEVIIQFDRSALGGAANLPVSPTTEGINGASVAMRGKLVSVSDNWIRIQVSVPIGNAVAEKTFWIARDKVLLLQQGGF